MPLMRGATPTARYRIEAAERHAPIKASPPQFLWKPPTLSMWGNDMVGNCVTAEEAFAKDCGGVFIPQAKVIKWGANHWANNGAGLWEIMTLMQKDGFYQGPTQYNDGPFKYVDYTNAAILRNAIAQGPVKIGVAANQIENVIQNYGVGKNGWVMTGFTKDGNLDHCTSLCGYGTFAWLTQQLGGAKPTAKISAATPVYAMYTWSSIGIIDGPSLLAICGEAWLRHPTTVEKPNPVTA